MVSENNEEKEMMLRHMKTKKAEENGDMAARDGESVRGRRAGLLMRPLWALFVSARGWSPQLAALSHPSLSHPNKRAC
jgi:hypothetical protein